MLNFSIEGINKFAFTLLLLNDSQSMFYSETIHFIFCKFAFSKTKMDSSYKNKYKDKVFSQYYLLSFVDYFWLFLTTDTRVE